MTYDDLNTMLDYHEWARDRVLDGAAALTPEQFTRELGNSFTSVRDTLAHNIDAESIWLSRWRGETPTGLQPGDRFPDLASIRTAWTRTSSELREFLRGVGPDGVGRVFEYKMFDGKTASQPFWQMLQHLVNHASYHRGQITTMLRQMGAPPAKSMDMSVFYRERGAKAIA